MRCEEIHSKHKLAGRDVVREDTSTVCRRFWEATGGEGSGCGAAELTFTRRKADLIFKRIFLAQYDSKGTGSSDHAARGAFPPRGRCLGAEEFVQTELAPTGRKSLPWYPFPRRGEPRVAATKDRYVVSGALLHPSPRPRRYQGAGHLPTERW